ncbi:uncharacterized protein YjbI with pentapeptide repeats [Paenibacillus castaneae]|uniref:right-handed parallel beta-helix repeat-containing protein n=1 Tax=Paenibacillus castaneae TaxID=474957 RepID=UPI000C9A38B5|nr:right-handed parallel beta-helix repeat-containing protein [Paenibacillus castaneae]NIK76085.1 uncharacterized protein YjbI with pentapeptide repeats [Paenibacillus castaneae]
MNPNGSYRIELDRFKISNNSMNAMDTADGINAAIVWARSEGYTHVILPRGTYSVRMNPNSLVAIDLLSGIHLELEQGCVITIEANSSPSYSIIQMKGISQAKLSGGKLVGDKKNHTYDMTVKFVRGGVNADGALNNDPAWIRSEVIDRYANPGLLASFRLWSISGVNATGYQFYQYKDSISKDTLVGSRTNGLFAPASTAGRGWFLNEEGDITKNNKMIFAIKPGTALTDNQIADIQAKIDHSSYTHEMGRGIGVLGSNHVDICGVEILNCTGDGIFTTWQQYLIDPALYTQEQMGQFIRIYDCHIHHCRRQGISICSSNDTHIYRNRIHDIGYDDDGITTNFRNGTPPMFGIDIESMFSETNIPFKNADRPNGIELNYRVRVSDNYIYNNARGHFINADGTDVVIQNNTFEGYNVGGVGSNSNFSAVKFLDNTFNSCDLTVQGNNFVNGGVFNKGNLKLLDVKGAVIQNCQLKEGKVNGSSVYGYFGTPITNVVGSTFTYAAAHGMGNGAQIVFEQWVGQVPTGISIDKLYYTVNITATSFQVSETLGGAPVILKDAGLPGFNISRFNYGRCYMTNITIERDWRPDNALLQGINLFLTGAVMENIKVKNYDFALLVPQDYAGRPNILRGVTLVEGSARLEGCHVSNGEFMRAKSVTLGAMDIQLGSTDDKFNRQVTVRNSIFHNLGVFMDGNSLLTGCTLINSSIGRANNTKKAVVSLSYLENTKLNFIWLNMNQSATVVKNVFKGVSIAGSSPYLSLVDNTDLGKI